jgi:hypothetical protein
MQLIAIQSLPGYLDNQHSPFGILNSLFCSRCCRDRFNGLNHYSKLNWVDSVDSIPEASETPIADLMDRRAEELIKQGSIAAQWSGGVDSTSLVLALIKNGISKEDLVILYDKNSVTEYPKLHAWFKEQGWNLKEVTKSWREDLGTIDTNVITNGWCADQLFGSIYFHENPKDYSKSFTELVSGSDVFARPLSRDTIKNAEEVITKYAEELFGVKLSIAAEFGWFTNFIMKWTWVSTYNNLYLASFSNRNKTQPFYNTDYFQAFAVGNFEQIAPYNIYGSDARYYKRPLKEYCNSIFPDEDYLTNKSKNPSWQGSSDRTLGDQPIITAKTTEGFKLFNPGSFSYTTVAEQIFTKFLKP